MSSSVPCVAGPKWVPLIFRMFSHVFCTFPFSLFFTPSLRFWILLAFLGEAFELFWPPSASYLDGLEHQLKSSGPLWAHPGTASAASRTLTDRSVPRVGPNWLSRPRSDTPRHHFERILFHLERVLEHFWSYFSDSSANVETSAIFPT